MQLAFHRSSAALGKIRKNSHLHARKKKEPIPEETHSVGPEKLAR